MKKKIIGVAIMAAIALGAGWNMMQSENDVDLTDLALSNVEALAQDEGGGSICTAGCTQIGWGFDSVLKCHCGYTGWLSSCEKWGCVQ